MCVRAIGVDSAVPGVRNHALQWRDGAALTTVLAAAGYPGTYAKGKPIHIPSEVSAASDVIVYHAGTAITAGQLVTAGGRVIAVTALGNDLAAAAARSRWAAERVQFEGKQYRRDIGWRELDRQRNNPVI